MARDQVLQLRASAEQRQLIDQAAAAEGISRTEFILRNCQERARDVLLDRTLFSLTPEQTTALLADLEDSGAAAQDQLEGFDCGNAALNRWLQQRALANERQAVSRTVVLCPDEDSFVITYVSTSYEAIERLLPAASPEA
jgi:uncharacterized protein (DUF1778 family)